MSETFYKIARPDGWDFYTGKTINYRENIGSIVRCPKKGKVKLCSPTAIHASRDPNQCFIGGGIPCSLYLVEGQPYAENNDKCGFRQLRILKELDPAKVFKWRYEEACNPIHPFKIKPPKKITETHITLLKEWASVGYSVWDYVLDSVGTSVWDSVEDSVRAYVGASVRNSVWASVGVSVGYSVEASVVASVEASVGAYIGYIFSPCIKEWKYIKHKKGEYPFQPAVDLWMMGLVPSFGERIRRLHGGEDGGVLWEEVTDE